MMKKERSFHKKFSRAVLSWFDKNMRMLPWRVNRTPYSVWISEIMLQQTIVKTVIPYYQQWMERFPDIFTLAGADETDLLRFWEGLGYYSRVRNILKTGRIIVDKYNGRLPDDYSELLRLPGIGDYTASAILSLAFSKPYPVLDANVKRIVQRLFASKEWNRRTAQELNSFLKDSIPPDDPGKFNEGLMELGQVVCTIENPSCPQCPLKKICMSLKYNMQNRIPARQERKSIARSKSLFLLLHKNKVLLIKKEKGLFSGLWLLPGMSRRKKNKDNESLIIKDTPGQWKKIKELPSRTHFYTKYAEKLYPAVYKVSGSYKNSNHGSCKIWVPLGKLDKLPFPSVYRRILEDMKKEIKAI